MNAFYPLFFGRIYAIIISGENKGELRPGNNRVLFFYHKDDTYVLLHQFRKKTQKTPRREIDKAKIERDDWKSRKG